MDEIKKEAEQIILQEVAEAGEKMLDRDLERKNQKAKKKLNTAAATTAPISQTIFFVKISKTATNKILIT